MRYHQANPDPYGSIVGIDDALIAAAITAAASAGSAIYSNNQNANNASNQLASMGNSQQANIDFNREQAGVARAFSDYQRGQQNIVAQDAATRAWERNQENFATAQQLANSTYQRTMKDMRAAGLNPILAYQRGNAQNTPQAAQISAASVSGPGSSPQASNSGIVSPSLPQVQDLLGAGGVSAATQAARGVADIKQTLANTTKTEQDTLLSQASTRRQDADTALALARTTTEGDMPANVRARTRQALASSTLNSAQALAVPSEIERNISTANAQEAASLESRQRVGDVGRFGRGPVADGVQTGVTVGGAIGREGRNAAQSPTGRSLPDLLRSINPFR